MMRGSTTEEFASFLAAHAPIRQHTVFAEGESVGAWRITAFLGKGGSGEVYRVERAASGDGTSGTGGTNGTEVAALKVSVKDGDAARARFQREMDLLSKNEHAAFPRFIGAGVVGPCVPRDRRDGEGGLPYYVMELLSPVELPSTDDDVAEYILAVSRAVAILHRNGLVHRDIKPQNIMRRANDELVLTDLGLVKSVTSDLAAFGASVTLVDGKVAGAGTPLYAAPEQFNGGAISPATDIHALGMLANECFGGKPPRTWERIIGRATSSIPERRYADIDAFTKAIRHRHCGRVAVCCGVAAASVALVVALAVGRACRSATAAPLPTWQSLACDIQTNLVERQIVYEKYAKTDSGTVIRTEHAWRTATNAVEGTVVRLNKQHHAFVAPMLLETNHVYWIVGPGTLDVPLNGKPGARVFLDNCVLINRTTNSVAACGVRYVFRKGAYLNFINLKKEGNAGYGAYVEDFDGAYNALEFGGPETLAEVLKRRDDHDAASLAEDSCGNEM